MYQICLHMEISLCIHIYMYAPTHIKPTHIFVEWKYLWINASLVFTDGYIISLQIYIYSSRTALEITSKFETWGLCSAIYFQLCFISAPTSSVN